MWLQIASLNNENLEQTFVAGRKREETKHVQRVEKTAGKTTTFTGFKAQQEHLSESVEK